MFRHKGVNTSTLPAYGQPVIIFRAMKTVYTTMRTHDILERLNIFRIIFLDEAFAHTKPHSCQSSEASV